MPVKGFKTVTIRDATEDTLEVILDLIKTFGTRELNLPVFAKIDRATIVTHLINDYYAKARTHLEETHGSAAIAEVVAARTTASRDT